MAHRINFNIKHCVVGVRYSNGAGQRYLANELSFKTIATYLNVKDDGTSTTALAIFAGTLNETQVRAALANK